MTVNYVYSKSIKHTTYIFNHIKLQRASNISLACLLAAVVWDRTKCFYDILSLKYFGIFCVETTSISLIQMTKVQQKRELNKTEI